MIVLDINCAKVSYLEKIQVMEITWKGFASVEDYQTTLNFAYKTVKEYKTPFWISDMRKAQVVKSENQQWLQETFIPKIFALNILRKGAYVVSENIFNKSYLNNIKKDLENNFEARYFHNRESALHWIEEY